MKVPASEMKASKFCAAFSQRTATHLKRLNLPTPCSARARPLLEGLGKESGFGDGILPVRNGGADAAPARRLSVRLGVIAFVAEHRPRGNVRANVGQVEGQRQAIEIELQVDFGEKPPRERPRACPFCPLLRPLPKHGRARSPSRLDEVSGAAHSRKKGEHRLENAPPTQPPKPLPHAVPIAKLRRQRSPGDVVNPEKNSALRNLRYRPADRPPLTRLPRRRRSDCAAA